MEYVSSFVLIARAIFLLQRGHRGTQSNRWHYWPCAGMADGTPQLWFPSTWCILSS